ncbi:MAG: c-type cytochrome [Lentisphaeria bacterium]|nr:c-type cytochrome [Lentisphaeria bacterium]
MRFAPFSRKIAMSMAIACLAQVRGARTELAPNCLAVSSSGTHLYIGETGARQVAVMDVERGSVTHVFPLKSPVNGIALSPDGKTLAVALGGAEGKLAFVDIDSGKTEKIQVGHTPCSPLFSPDGETVYVCNRFSNNVMSITRKGILATINVVREPIASALSADGSRLFVGNHLPEGAANGNYAGVVVSIIDTKKNEQISKLALPNGSTSLRGMCLSADGKHVYTTHILARYQLPTTQLERGWMNTNALTVIDALEGAVVNTVLLDDVDLGAANPWGVACTADGEFICVAVAGTHELHVIDAQALHERLVKASRKERVTEVTSSPSDVPNDLSFLVGIKRRLKLAGNGPRSIAIASKTAYTTEYFTDTIGTVNLAAEIVHHPRSIPLGPKEGMSEERRGEMFFNDANYCFQKWQSCASCHPDGRADGLNWDLLNDGMGNPKQTKNMLLAHRTPRAMVTGIRESAEVAVRAGLKFIQFSERPEKDARAIDSYLKSMKPVPSPYLIRGRLSKAARRGKKLFKKAACASCHPAPLFTDKKMYNVGLGLGRHKGAMFDTPTLIENWRTAPFLYDGRAATMLEVLTKYNMGDTHGVTSNLSEKEIADLAEFVLSQ